MAGRSPFGVSHWLPYRSFALKACLPVLVVIPFQPNNTIRVPGILLLTLHIVYYYTAICGLSARDGIT